MVLAVWLVVTYAIKCFMKWTWNTRMLVTLGGLFSPMVISMLVKFTCKRSIGAVATIRCKGALYRYLAWPCRDRGIGQCPLSFTFLVSGEEDNALLPWDLVLLRNPGDVNQRSRSSTTTFPHLEVPMVEDMLHKGKSSLTEAVVTGPRRAVLFYGTESLGKGLSLGEARDAMFTPSGAVSWIGKLAPVSSCFNLTFCNCLANHSPAFLQG